MTQLPPVNPPMIEERPAKEPWLAASLSWLLPGLGQFYAGAWLGGAAMLGLNLLVGIGTTWALFCPQGTMLAAVVMILACLLLAALNIWLAHRAARRVNSPAGEVARKACKDPYLAFFLSLLLPGIGHLYLRRWVWGIALFLVAMAIARLPILWSIAVNGLFAPVAALLAWRAGPPQRQGRRTTVFGLTGLAIARLALVFGAALLFRVFLVHAFSVPLGSMAPAIEPGDRVLVWKQPWQIQRGDIIVFRNPTDREQSYVVKRVAALGGETVECRPDGLYVNGARVAAAPLDQMTFNTLPNQEYALEGRPFTVPPGHLFVLGDNTAKSFDGRFFGPVPTVDVIGKAYKRYWPLSHVGPLR